MREIKRWFRDFLRESAGGYVAGFVVGRVESGKLIGARVMTLGKDRMLVLFREYPDSALADKRTEDASPFEPFETDNDSPKAKMHDLMVHNRKEGGL